MRFRFNEKKAAQAAAFILKRHGDRINYMVLIKLLYLADRGALIERGLPITGDRFVSMPHGPVLSMILDLINMGRSDPPTPWFEHISEPSDHEVTLLSAAGDDELSEYELDLLSTIDKRFGGMNKWALRDYTHTLPEWEDPKGSSLPIEPADLLRKADVPPETIRQIGEEAEDMWSSSLMLFGR